MITEQIDKLFLELSQFTKVKTRRECALETVIDAALQELARDDVELPMKLQRVHAILATWRVRVAV